MTTITTIDATDLISDSRTDINTNFTNLNSDKIETSYLDTDTAMAANSDVKIPSQKAVKTYIDTSGGANASETVRGIVEEATDAEVTAGTATGATGAKLIVTPAKLATRLTAVLPNSAKTIIPKPIIPLDPDGTTVGVGRDLGVATTMHVGMITIPLQITVNKVSVRTGTMAGTGTYDITLYSEDGQTKTVLVADGSIDSTDDDVVKTFTITETTLTAGNYYLAVNIVNASGGVLHFYDTANTIPFSSTAGLGEDVSSEPVLQGTIAISSGTPPATITPTAITGAPDSCLIVRFDN